MVPALLLCSLGGAAWACLQPGLMQLLQLQRRWLMATCLAASSSICHGPVERTELYRIVTVVWERWSNRNFRCSFRMNICRECVRNCNPLVPCYVGGWPLKHCGASAYTEMHFAGHLSPKGLHHVPHKAHALQRTVCYVATCEEVAWARLSMQVQIDKNTSDIAKGMGCTGTSCSVNPAVQHITA